MMFTLTGQCHCGNLSYELHTGTEPERIRARACDCSFCRLHAAMNWSDPDGTAVIRVADESQIQKYRFALRTADFLICRICGVYLGAVLADNAGAWSTLNLRLTGLAIEEDTTSFAGEDTSGRIDRRKRVWTPTTMLAIG